MSTRNRPRRDTRPPRIVAATGLAVACVLLTIIVIALLSPNGLPLRDYQELRGIVPDAGNLQPHNEVRVRGTRVGQVIKVESAGRAARIRFKLDPGSGSVPSDSTLAIRARGLLGQRYLEIVPGRAPTPAQEGTVLRGGRDALTFGVPDVLDTLDADARGGLHDTLGGLGTGLARRGGGINDGLRLLPDGQADARRVIDTILARGDALRTLAPSLAEAAGELDASAPDLVALLDPASRAVRPLVDRRARVRETLSELPPTLAAATPAFRDGRVLLAAARAVATSVNRTLPAAPAALRETTALLETAPTPLRRTTVLLRGARAAIPPTLRLTSAARPLLKPIRGALDDLGPVVRIVGPYGCDLVNLGDNWHSALGWGQEVGNDFGPLNNFRVIAISGPDAIAGLGQTLTPAPLVHKNVYPPACKYSPGGTYTGDLVPGGKR